jgi:DegV family protein with EDD domain
MIHILTDSCSDLNPDLLNSFNIDVIRLPVYINDQTYTDGADIDHQTLFALVEKTGKLPKTSAPSAANFQTFFNQPGETIYIGISSKLSATLSNAILACQNLPENQVHIIDSLNLSSGIGLLVLKAADLRNQGLSAAEIVMEIACCIPEVHSSFVIDTLDYLYKGGRCSSMQFIFGSMLKIRPVIEVRLDGTLGIREKIRGSRKKALDSMLEEFKGNIDRVDLHRVFVTHTGCDEDAAYLVSELLRLAPISQVLVTIAGATISSHCGPDTIGILYLTDH